MPHVTRMIVLGAFALAAVACSYASGPASSPPPAGGTAVLRGAATAAVRTDVQRSREAAPRATELPATHRACAFGHGAAC